MGIKEVTAMRSMCDQLAQDAATVVRPHDSAELEAFAAKLCGLEGLDLDGLRERLADVEIPLDFRHFRLHNLTTGLSAGGLYCLKQSRFTLDELLIHMSITAKADYMTPQGRGVWTRTVALPIKDPGVLELGVEFLPLN